MPLFRVQSQSLREKEIPRRGEGRGGRGGKAVQKRGNFRGVGSGFSRCFPEALGKIGELLKSNSCSVESAR